MPVQPFTHIDSLPAQPNVVFATHLVSLSCLVSEMLQCSQFSAVGGAGGDGGARQKPTLGSTADGGGGGKGGQCASAQGITPGPFRMIVSGLTVASEILPDPPTA